MISEHKIKIPAIKKIPARQWCFRILGPENREQHGFEVFGEWEVHPHINGEDYIFHFQYEESATLFALTWS